MSIRDLDVMYIEQYTDCIDWIRAKTDAGDVM